MEITIQTIDGPFILEGIATRTDNHHQNYHRHGAKQPMEVTILIDW